MRNFEFEGLFGCDSVCGLDIYNREDGKIVVLLTELHDNHGTSVTNAIEMIAEQVVEQFDLKDKEIIWVEHYPEVVDEINGRVLHDDTFAIVELKTDGEQWYDPKWVHTNYTKLASLIS